MFVATHITMVRPAPAKGVSQGRIRVKAWRSRYGLVKLGRVESGREALKKADSVQVTIRPLNP
jgi:hypothetical protein